MQRSYLGGNILAQRALASLLRMYITPLITSRIATRRLPPPGLPDGNSGSICAHCIGQVARITQFVAVVARAVARQSTWGTSRANSPPQRITADSALQEGAPDNRFIRLIKSPDGHLESVRRLYVGLQSFRSMSRMDASLTASALRLRFSQSASRRQRLSQAHWCVRPPNAWAPTTKPFPEADRLFDLGSRSGRMPARAR